jgi:hypothetical protein
MIASIDGESELEVKQMSHKSLTTFIGTGWHRRQGSEELGPARMHASMVGSSSPPTDIQLAADNIALALLVSH